MSRHPHPTLRRTGASAILVALLVAACGSTPSPTPGSAEPTSPASPAASPASSPAASPSSSGGAVGSGSPSTGTICADPNALVSPAPSIASEPSAEAPAADPAIEATYDSIEGQVVDLRGLPAVDVARRTIGAEELKAINTHDFDQDNPASYVAANEQLYRSLGLLGTDESLRTLFLALVDSQVAGFYRPEAKTLYVVSRSGTLNGADKITFAHEYDHALQDHAFSTVFPEQAKLQDQSDRALAHASVFEGDATLLMTQWAIANLSPSELGDVAAAGADPTATAILERTPAILREGLLFPYNAGVALLSPRQQAGGWGAVDDVYARLPESTEQVMHPEKYDAKEAPVEVALPTDLADRLGSGWSVILQDTFGEFQIRTWLRETGVRQATADAAAEGWGGDRLAVLHGPDGDCAVAWQTEWDTPADAEAFEAAATQALGAAGGRGAVYPGEGGTVRWVVIGSDDETLAAAANALGLAG
jgi:hypothetical protein